MTGENSIERPESFWPVPKQEVIGDRGGAFAWLEFAAMRGVVSGFSILPEVLLRPWIGGLARIGKLIDRRHARAAAEYLRTALPHESEEQIDRRVLQAYRHLLGMTVRGERWARRIRSWGPDDWREHVEVEVSERARKAIDSEGGLLVVGAHLGDWEVGSAFVPRVLANRPVYIVSRPPRNRPMSIQAQRQREQRGVRLLPRRGSMQSVRAVVEGGGALCLLLDQRARQRPIYAPLFGRRARCDRSAGALLKRLRVPVVFATCYLHPDPAAGKTFRLVFSEALFPEDLRGCGPAEIAALVNQELGKRILEAPDQYFWLHDRYRGGEDPADEKAL